MLTLFLLTAQAKAAVVATTELAIDATPVGWTMPGSTIAFVDRPKTASATQPWASDYAPATCKNLEHQVAVSVALDPNAWPYSLPEKVTCTQGTLDIEVRLSFKQPAVRAWVAADGTIVVPVAAPSLGQHQWRDEAVWLMDVRVASAEATPSGGGLGCSANPMGGLVVELRVTGATVEPAVCHIVAPNGVALDRTLQPLLYAK